MRGRDKGVGQGGHLPAVRTVFLMDSIIRLSPEACKRTLVRSSGLGHRQGQGAAARSRGDSGDEDAYWVIDAAIVAATPIEGKMSIHSRDQHGESTACSTSKPEGIWLLRGLCHRLFADGEGSSDICGCGHSGRKEEGVRRRAHETRVEISKDYTT
jgi:hypothetical protein